MLTLTGHVMCLSDSVVFLQEQHLWEEQHLWDQQGRPDQIIIIRYILFVFAT